MLRFAIHTFGCQMNAHDSARMAESLRRAGLAEVEAGAEADVLVLNTCSVREKAEHKLRSEVGRVAALKRARPGLKLVVAGCVAQQEGAALVRSLPAIDVVVGPDNLGDLPELLTRSSAAAPVVLAEHDVLAPRFLKVEPGPGRCSPVALVTTMKGCDERCTFCIVPTTRGPERYRPSDEILEEVERLVAQGAREVTLLGQTVNSYRAPDAQAASSRSGPAGATDFPGLLRAIAERASGLLRLRYTSPHPRHVTPALVRAHAELPVLARHVHLPVQSGSDRILRRMLRRYDRAGYLEKVAALRGAVPDLTLSTDVIVGFPGETEADFRATLSLVEEVGFTGLFGFAYSPRPGTPALRLGDDVPQPEKSERLSRLFEVSNRLRERHLSSLVGTDQVVLAEGVGEDGAYFGRTDRNEIVHFCAARDLTGELVRVRVERAFRNSLDATPTDAALRAPASPQRRARRLPVVTWEAG